MRLILDTIQFTPNQAGYGLTLSQFSYELTTYLAELAVLKSWPENYQSSISINDKSDNTYTIEVYID